MTTSPHLKHCAASYLALSALAIVLSPAYGATVTDGLVALTSSVTVAASSFHAGTDALTAKLTASE